MIDLERAGALVDHAVLMTTTRSPRVMASSWSWVTYTVVLPNSRCSRLISARISTRSLASRFESGSSKENTAVAHDGASQGHALALPT